MDSRKQFEEWFHSRYASISMPPQDRMMLFANQWAAWQASRAAIEISLWPYLNPLMFNDDVLFGYHKAKGEATECIRAAGLKVKGDSDGKD